MSTSHRRAFLLMLTLVLQIDHQLNGEVPTCELKPMELVAMTGSVFGRRGVARVFLVC